MSDEYESVTEAELREFLENYPRKLVERGTNICSPPLTWYVDDESGVTVAKEFEGTSKKDDLWYMPENERYYILRNYEEVIELAIAEMKRPPKIYANAVLKDGKLIFWWTGEECTELYDFFKDFWSAGLNFAMEIETCRYKLVKQEIEKFEDDKNFYRQYEMHEDFKGEKPY